MGALVCACQGLSEIAARDNARASWSGAWAHALLEAAVLCCGVGVAKRRLRAAGSRGSLEPLASGEVESGGRISAWLSVHCRYEGFHRGEALSGHPCLLL